MAKQLHEVYFYGSQVCRSQCSERTKILRYFTNKSNTRFDYQKSLIKKISLNPVLLNKDIFFIRKKIRLNINFFLTQVYFD